MIAIQIIDKDDPTAAKIQR